MSEAFSECRKCGNKMVRISPVDSSPLIVECQKCGHREHAEVQISPGWLPDTGEPSTDATEADTTDKRFRFLDLSATPVSFGPADEETTVIPVGWLYKGVTH